MRCYRAANWTVLGDICVSVAGGAANFLIAVMMILPLNMVHMVSSDLTGLVAVYVLLHVALLNIVLAMYNLIPIPPLDGSHLFKYLLPLELRGGHEMLGRTAAGFIILILVINIPGLWNIFSTAFIGVRDFLRGTLIFF